jgi:putative endonuclease
MELQIRESWYVYIVICSDQTYYTGITKDLKRRLFEHNNQLKGAKYTRTRRPVELVYHAKMPDIQKALQEERKIKKWPKKKKLDLVKSKKLSDNFVELFMGTETPL